MKGTKLWNQPRSPLIQGRSRRERPFWSDWLAAVVVALAVGAVVTAALLVPRGTALASVMGTLAVPMVVGAAVGCGAGVWLAAAFGWHPRWVAASVSGSAVVIIATWMAVALGAGPA